MFAFLKKAFIVLTLLAATAVAANSCRQCDGMMTLDFKLPVTQDQVKRLAAVSLHGCATGDQYDIIGYSHRLVVCDFPHVSACYEWKVHLKVWRYCGNGGMLDFTRNDFCSAGVCALEINLLLACDKSVTCATDCNMAQCT